MIPGVVALLGTILDKIFPNADDAAKAKLELLKLEQQGAFAQLEVNKIEASHASLFVAGARPAILWICAAIFAYNFLLQPLLIFIFAAADNPIPNLPALETGEVMSVLLGLLGLGGMRTYEKVKGVSREAISTPNLPRERDNHK